MMHSCVPCLVAGVLLPLFPAHQQNGVSTINCNEKKNKQDVQIT
uniref:Uncharacterized protein n=1 Tax=Rhizophora mucronata TaxID=61149 RepID=A0A2P2NPX7_RHIMU